MTRHERINSAIKHTRTFSSASSSCHAFYVDGNPKKYFQHLKRILKIGLILAYIIPVTILILFFDAKFKSTVHESSNLHLAAVTESQRNTIDLFMKKRVVNIFNLFHIKNFSLEPNQEEMDYYLENLMKADDAFEDIGFFNPSGIQVGYAGPYQHLLYKDYSGEEWYVELMSQSQSYIITDLYLGLRFKPHFTIGVKQLIEDRYYVIRVSLHPDKLYDFLKTTSQGKEVDGFLVNREGMYQAVDTAFGSLLEPAIFIPPKDKTSDIAKLNFKGKPVLLAYAWLKDVPWCLVMWQPADIVLKAVNKTRRAMIISTAILILVLVIIVWMIVNWIIKWANSLENERDALKTQLYHTHKLSAVGQLASGVAHEINNPLAIISNEAGLIRDMLDPSMGLDWSPPDIIKELDVIDKAVTRAQSATKKIQSFVRKNDPKLSLCDINDLFEEFISGVKEKQLSASNITIVRNYEPEVPKIMLDADLMRQVILNLINNAADSITEKKGVITVRTYTEDNWIKIAISDNGIGIDSKQIQKIFMPFYTTKEVGKGTGLGLTISLNIIENFGGYIEVKSEQGTGSTFTVALPAATKAVK